MGLFATLTPFDNWFLQSNDNEKEKVQGQFPITPNKNIGSKFASHGALNRKTPIVQFLSGASDKISFAARFFARDMFFSGVQDSLDQLEAWAKPDETLRRPHILSFWVGDGHLGMSSCYIESLGESYQQPNVLGAIRDVTITINLVEYTDFNLEGIALGETLYYRAKERDYYELLAQSQYGNALLGDVIRKRHPDKKNIGVADIIKLPSIEIIRKESVTPKSLQLQTAYGRRETDQRALRLKMFERRQRTHYSHVLKA